MEHKSHYGVHKSPPHIRSWNMSTTTKLGDHPLSVVHDFAVSLHILRLSPSSETCGPAVSWDQHVAVSILKSKLLLNIIYPNILDYTIGHVKVCLISLVKQQTVVGANLFISWNIICSVTQAKQRAITNRKTTKFQGQDKNISSQTEQQIYTTRFKILQKKS
jgi:hypothetical protein